MRMAEQRAAGVAERPCAVAEELIIAVCQPLGQGINVVRRTDRSIEHDLVIAQPFELFLTKQNHVLVQAATDDIDQRQQLRQRQILDAPRFLVRFSAAAELIQIGAQRLQCGGVQLAGNTQPHNADP